jgi:hypothetical protein
MATWDIDKITKSFSDPIAMIEAMNTGTLQDQIKAGPQRQQTDSFNGFVNGQYGSPTDDMSSFDITLASTNNPDMAANAAHDNAKFKESDLVQAYKDLLESKAAQLMKRRLKNTNAMASAAAESVMERYPEMDLGLDSPMLAPPELAEYGEAFHLKDYEQNILSTTAESFGITPGEIDDKIREIQKQGALTDDQMNEVVSGGDGTPKIDAWKDWYGEGWEDADPADMLKRIKKLWLEGKGFDNDDNAKNALWLGLKFPKDAAESIWSDWYSERYGIPGPGLGHDDPYPETTGHSDAAWGLNKQLLLASGGADDNREYDTSAWHRYYAKSDLPSVYMYDPKNQYLFAAAERLGAQADMPGIRAKIEANWSGTLANYTLREMMKDDWNPMEGTGLNVYDYTVKGFTQKPGEFYSPESDKDMIQNYGKLVRASGPGWGQNSLRASRGFMDVEGLTRAELLSTNQKLMDDVAMAILKKGGPGGLRGRKQERGLQAARESHYQKQANLPLGDQVGFLHTLSQMKGTPWYAPYKDPDKLLEEGIT